VVAAARLLRAVMDNLREPTRSSAHGFPSPPAGQTPLVDALDRLVRLDARVGARVRRTTQKTTDRLLGRRLAQGLRGLDARALGPLDRHIQRHPRWWAFTVGLLAGAGSLLSLHGWGRLTAIGVALFWGTWMTLMIRRSAKRQAGVGSQEAPSSGSPTGGEHRF
jgi:hypothetical protein